MPTTFKPVIYAHQRRQDGTYNVKIRVTHNRKTRNLPTNVSVETSQITRGLKIKDHQVLDSLAEIVKRMRDAVSSMGFEVTMMDVDQVVAAIRRKLEDEARFELDFYEYGMAYAKTRKRGTRINYEGAFKHVLKYSGGTSPDINDVTARWLRGFIAYLQKLDLDPETIQSYVSKLSKVHALARLEFNDEDGGVIRIPGTPFNVVKAPRPPKVKKHYNLSREAIQRIIDLPPVNRINSNANLARDLFLLSFTMQGMNIVDLWDAVEAPDGFVTYFRKKTIDQHPVRMVVRIEPEARKLFEPYIEGGRLLARLRAHYKSYTTFYSGLVSGMDAVAEAIGEPDARIYSARHSWATFARNDCGIDKWTVHEALSHSDRATAIDDVYIATDYSKFWVANRAVLDLFRWD